MAAATRCNVLLVYPRFDLASFWSLTTTCQIAGKRRMEPPLGLITVAAMLPADWSVRLIDRNAEDVTESDLAWADMVMTGGMIPQRADTLRLIELVHSRGKPVVVGGPDITSSPQVYGHADFRMPGEAEATIAAFVDAWNSGERRGLFEAEKFTVDVSRSPLPRFDLLKFEHYLGLSVQFSRGCPHLCNYCGQRGFWTRWRHRDPKKLAAEIGRLHREHGVQVFNFADENPSAGRKPWKAFLEALIAENVDVTLVGSTRADDIVRDADILHLYKKAGFERFLMGMENTDEATLALIKKGGTTAADREAIQLLRKHGILSLATWVAGFDEQTDRDFWRGLRQLISYDPDQIITLYATPHRWTPYYKLVEHRRVIQPDQRKWDYKHQVLSMRHMPPWRVFLWVKFIEVVAQARPRALARLLWHPDKKIHHAIRWYYQMGRRVWFHEVISFFLRERRVKDGVTVAEFLGASQEVEEESMAVKKRAAA